MYSSLFLQEVQHQRLPQDLMLIIYLGRRWQTKDSRQFFVTCHAEYDANTLALEYNRDMEKGLTSVDLPINYFPDDDPTKAPVVTWRSTGQLLYSNWLNFYVYQSTPYDIKDIK